jgi:hypothetical protein
MEEDLDAIFSGDPYEAKYKPIWLWLDQQAYTQPISTGY